MMKLLIYLLILIMISFKLKYQYIYNLVMLMILLMLLNINYMNYWNNIYYLISNDSLSFNLSLLSIYIISLMLMYKSKFNMYLNYILMILILLLFLILSFNTMNYFLFYLFFEISLIPTFFLIMGWGYQPERIQASMYMLLYTLFASLPLLLIIYLLMNNMNTLFYMFMYNNYYINNINFNELIFYLYMIFAYLVKLPMYLMHLWLPKAHVEAPVTGSMILAGVMLKLGGYGIIRSMMMMINYCKFYNWMIMILSLLGMFNLSLMCLRQNDLKSLVAYSSIVHMMLMLMGLLSMKKMGMYGGIIMMISHGLCSSGLFYLVNLNYETFKTRNFLIIKGMILIFPTLTMWWFMFISMNMAAPPSLNLLSELLIFNILLNWSFKIIFILMLVMLLSMMYSLYLFSYSQHGSYNNNYKFFKFINISNFFNLIMHWIPLNFLFLKTNLFF